MKTLGDPSLVYLHLSRNNEDWEEAGIKLPTVTFDEREKSRLADHQI